MCFSVKQEDEIHKPSFNLKERKQLMKEANDQTIDRECILIRIRINDIILVFLFYFLEKHKIQFLYFFLTD